MSEASIARGMDRRRLLSRGAVFASLGLLGGCNFDDPQHPDLADRFLHFMSRWNDRVQAALFDPNTLAPTFSVSAITRPPRFNAYYGIDHVRVVDGATWRLELSGRIADKRPWRLADLRAAPQASQITRLVCVEGWRVIGQWRGVPFGWFLRRIGADLRAPYVAFRCADDYWTSIDMASALQSQTTLALDFLGKPLTPPFGFPVRLRIPTKLGFKNPKSLVAIEVTDRYPGGYWEDQGYNWFSGS